MTALRPFQADAIERLRDAYRRGARAPLLLLPTGGGKTIILTSVAAAAAAKGRSVLVLVHRRELVRHVSEKLTAASVARGTIAPGYAVTGHTVQLASVQTLARRLEQMRHALPRLIIIEVRPPSYYSCAAWGRDACRGDGPDGGAAVALFPRSPAGGPRRGRLHGDPSGAQLQAPRGLVQGANSSLCAR